MASTEETTLKSLLRVLQIYAGESENGFLDLKEIAREDFWFRDPFSEAHGFENVMGHFGSLAGDHVKMVWDIQGKAVCGTSAYLRWRYTTEYTDGTKTDFDGMSEFLFDDEGRFAAHVDYFDGMGVIAQRRSDLSSAIASLKDGFHV